MQEFPKKNIQLRTIHGGYLLDIIGEDGIKREYRYFNIQELIEGFFAHIQEEIPDFITRGEVLPFMINKAISDKAQEETNKLKAQLKEDKEAPLCVKVKFNAEVTLCGKTFKPFKAMLNEPRIFSTEALKRMGAKITKVTAVTEANTNIDVKRYWDNPSSWLISPSYRKPKQTAEEEEDTEDVA